eukprot:11766917-Alexandrium_andersonii.AAC.1
MSLPGHGSGRSPRARPASTCGSGDGTSSRQRCSSSGGPSTSPSPCTPRAPVASAKPMAPAVGASSTRPKSARAGSTWSARCAGSRARPPLGLSGAASSSTRCIPGAASSSGR